MIRSRGAGDGRHAAAERTGRRLDWAALGLTLLAVVVLWVPPLPGVPRLVGLLLGALTLVAAVVFGVAVVLLEF